MPRKLGYYVPPPEEKPDVATWRKIAAPAVRVAGPWVGAIAGTALDPILGPAGTILGGAGGGAAGEYLAELLEGSDPSTKRMLVEAAMGAVPAKAAYSVGKIGMSALKGTALAEAGNMGRRKSQGGTLFPQTLDELKSDALGMGIGGITGGLTGKLTTPKSGALTISPRSIPDEVPSPVVAPPTPKVEAGTRVWPAPGKKPGRVEAPSPIQQSEYADEVEKSLEKRLGKVLPVAPGKKDLEKGISEAEAIATSQRQGNLADEKLFTKNAANKDIAALRSHLNEKARQTVETSKLGLEPETTVSTSVKSKTPTGTETATTRYVAPNPEEAPGFGDYFNSADEAVELGKTLPDATITAGPKGFRVVPQASVKTGKGKSTRLSRYTTASQENAKNIVGDDPLAAPAPEVAAVPETPVVNPVKPVVEVPEQPKLPLEAVPSTPLPVEAPPAVPEPVTTAPKSVRKSRTAAPKAVVPAETPAATPEAVVTTPETVVTAPETPVTTSEAPSVTPETPSSAPVNQPTQNGRTMAESVVLLRKQEDALVNDLKAAGIDTTALEESRAAKDALSDAFDEADWSWRSVGKPAAGKQTRDAAWKSLFQAQKAFNAQVLETRAGTGPVAAPVKIGGVAQTDAARTAALAARNAKKNVLPVAAEPTPQAPQPVAEVAKPVETPAAAPQQPGKVMSPEELADQMGISLRTVYRALKSKQLEGDPVGRQWRISQENVRKWIEKNRGQKGEIDPLLLARLGMTGIGAATGYATDPLDDPYASAAAGGVAGFTAPSLIQGLMKGRGSELAETGYEKLTNVMRQLPNFQRSNYLSNPHSVLVNSALAPWSGGVLGSLEQMLSGTEGGKQAFKASINPMNFAREWLPAWDRAQEILNSAKGFNEKAGRFDVDFSDTKHAAKSVMALPALGMTAADESIRATMGAGGKGLPEEMTRRISLTSEPQWKTPKKFTDIARGGNPDEKQAIAAQMMMPFARTSLNALEQGIERVPGLGLLAQMWKERPDPIGMQFVQQGMGAATWYLGYAVGQATPPENVRTVYKYVKNMGGQYSLLTGAGFMMAQAQKAGKLGSPVDFFRESAQQIIDAGVIPSNQVWTDMQESLQKLTELDSNSGPTDVYGAIPRSLKPGLTTYIIDELGGGDNATPTPAQPTLTPQPVPQPVPQPQVPGRRFGYQRNQ